ncbi:MAG: LPS assembly lipoprotein LptE [Thermodesulfovibrionales bacterium]|nr:LPS assembly lipoprotein LptE [Thermodesulfovibrionales bacterium]
MQKEKLKISIKDLKLFFNFTLLFFVFTFYGCGYTIQTRANLPFDAISIGKIENKTLEPKLQDRFSRALAETFSEYGFHVDPSSRHLLECEITKFELMPVAERNMTAIQYILDIKAKFTVRDLKSGTSVVILVETPFITYFTSADRVEAILAQKELSTDSALRNLAQELIRRIIYEY